MSHMCRRLDAYVLDARNVIGILAKLDRLVIPKS